MNFGIRVLHQIAIASLVVLFVVPAVAKDLTDFSLEELLEIEIDELAIAGIHHTHNKGEWMAGYHFMAMGMDGLRDGSRRRTDAQVMAQGFPVAPTDMYMEMHMLHLMYGATDELSFMLMVPFVRKTMNHVRMDGVRFKTRSEGIGDLELSALYSLYRNTNHRLIGIAGLSFPTGSIDADDRLPGTMMNPSSNQRLPYPMQLGSGSVDVELGATYIGQSRGWSWGAHSSGKIRTHENKHDYRLGNSYEISGWAARKFTGWSSGSVQLKWNERFNIHGADPALNPAIVPTADPELQAGRRLDVLLGVNIFQSKGVLDGLRVSVDGGIPIYQRLDGPQLETDWIASFTIEWTQ